MKRAFVITIELDEEEDLAKVAFEISDALEFDGFEVESVNPWDSSDSEPATPSQPFPRF